jgi:hypothetical protein
MEAITLNLRIIDTIAKKEENILRGTTSGGTPHGESGERRRSMTPHRDSTNDPWP